MLQGGQRISGRVLGDWHQGPPTLDGRNLFSEDPPLLWLLDRDAFRPPTASRFIESFTGERLPGKVIAFRAGSGRREEAPIPHFLVRSPAIAALPGAAEGRLVRFASRWVKRIVWNGQTPLAYQPGTAFFQNGRQLRFRALRFSDRQVRLLARDGLQTVPWEDLRELHFPKLDTWETYLDELAALTAGSGDNLIQLETTLGLVMTSTRRLLRSRAATNPPSARWLYGMHPAWSLDAVWIPAETIRVWRQFPATLVPLTRIDPDHVETRLSLGGPGPLWQVNRNVQGGPLRSGGLEHGWGFGVHAFSELGFPLPPLPCTFRTRVGLDHISGSGGCVQARILLDHVLPPRFETPPLIGSQDLRRSGNINCEPTPSEPRRLVLQVDPLIAARPAGADPLEIRDSTNWLEPTIELAAKPLTAELRRRYPLQIEAWRGWKLSTSPDDEPQFERVWDTAASSAGRLLTAVVAERQPLVLTSLRKLTAQDRWLVVGVSRSAVVEHPPQLEFRLNGQLLTTAPVPLRNGPQRTLAALSARISQQLPAGTESTLEIRQMPHSDRVPVRWHSIGLVDQLPTRYELLDEPAPADAVAPDPVPWTAQTHYSGDHAAQVGVAEPVHLAPSRELAIRQFPRWGEFRFLRFALRPSAGGRVFLEIRKVEPGAPSIGYLVGPAKQPPPRLRQVWKEPLPDRWLVITRDLFRDFGACEIASLTIRLEEGGPVAVDHLYLSSRTEDLEEVAPTTPPD